MSRLERRIRNADYQRRKHRRRRCCNFEDVHSDYVKDLAQEYYECASPSSRPSFKRVADAWQANSLQAQAFSSAESSMIREGLNRFAAYSEHWVRPPESWKSNKRRPKKLIQSLLHHLFVRYAPPRALEPAWFLPERDGMPRHREWYLHLAVGGRLRDCELPFPLTKRMCHYFALAPSEMTVDQAVRWSQVRGLGGSDELAESIARSRLGANIGECEFWNGVVLWFVKHSIPAHQAGPLIDFIHAQRFGDDEPPTQPRFSIKHRTPRALIRQMNRWHRRLRYSPTRLQHSAEGRWPSCGIQGLDCAHPDGATRVVIYELLTADELFREGRDLRHCVATYASKCFAGDSSIWSMIFVNVETDHVTHGLTIELQHQSIVQARGMLNRMPNVEEMEWLQLWAMRAGVHVPQRHFGSGA